MPSGNATFASWSDGGAAAHTVTVPATDQGYSATYTVTPVSAPIAFVQVAAATPQTDQTAVPVALATAQVAGNLNAVVVGWNDVVANVASVTDTAGNTYLPAAPVTRGAGISQAVYYATNIAGGGNTVTVTFDRPAVYVDVRVAEYSGLDRATPVDATASAAGTAATANSGNATTTAARTLLLGAGTTTGGFGAAGTGYTTRIITVPDQDILADRAVTAAGHVQRHGRRQWGMGDAARRLPRRGAVTLDG